MRRTKAISPLIATILLITITIFAALVVYRIYTSILASQSRSLNVQVVSGFIFRLSNSNTIVSINIKNSGTVAISSCQATFYGDGSVSCQLDVGAMLPGQTKNATALVTGLPVTVGNSYPVVIYAAGGNDTFSVASTMACEGSQH
jgi:hypothetical protein